MSSFIKPESENEFQPNFVSAISEINQPKFQEMKNKIESSFLCSLRLEKFKSRETFSLEVIQTNVMDICAAVFTENIGSREFEASAVASNFVIQKNQHFAKQIELLDEISKKQAKNRQKMDMFDKFPNAAKRVYDGNLSIDTQVHRTSCLFFRKLIAFSLSNEDLKENFKKVFSSEDSISKNRTRTIIITKSSTSLLCNSLWKNNAIERLQYRFQFFHVLQNPQESNEGTQTGNKV